MSEKTRKKKDGEDKNKNNQRMREANDENKSDEKDDVIKEINEPGKRNPTSERTQNPNYK